MADFVQFAMSGLTVGAVYALVALGFTLIYNASSVVNFAQGEFVMLGGMATVFLAALGLPIPLAALIAVAVAVATGLLVHTLVIEPARGANAVTLIILTIGVSLVLRGAAPLVFDKQFHKLPGFSGEEPVSLLGASVQPQAFWVVGGMAVIVLALRVFLARTLFGKAVLATAADRMAARLAGINTSVIVGFCFAMSAAIGAIAGILVTPITLTSYDVGVILSLKGFAAAVLGGIGNPLGAVAGGLLLGLLESFAAGYLSSTYKDAVAFAILIAVLIVMPGGLARVKHVERV
ncbi:branched-chain amino acid ABC transporter permease [Blastochloris tepida]|jgi:branched-chain amino acid transport system permease protein|uniref:Branched-chain amino acid ABC transporter permease n=1 Tax=Blastochloris tepida TaxID=2233851 RepID=A0A348FWG5_9HYPH|nr:branched-chain amino acid ABC transporter permease [Blastochloris tepida]BBF91648.1 branched-chain amino acid ABC transporter permease [Blastochloris tepida]